MGNSIGALLGIDPPNKTCKTVVKILVREDVPTKDITIPRLFASTTPSEKKYKRHLDYYKNNNKLIGTVIVNTRNMLVDNYTDYILAVNEGIEVIPCLRETGECAPIKTVRRKLSRSLRKVVYDKTGGKCAKCGCKLRLYHNINGNDDNYMTIDHIVPASLGGCDKIENYQPMCEKCNLEKGNDLEE